MMDLGAHVMYLSRWILGKPKYISSVFNNFTNKAVEDNAVSVIEFENKAIAIAETGFVSTNSPYSLELYGTEGSLFVGGPENKVMLNSTKINKDYGGWVIPSKLPEKLPRAIDQWVDGILNNSQIYFGLEEGLQLTELMEAAYISHKESHKVEIV